MHHLEKMGRHEKKFEFEKVLKCHRRLPAGGIRLDGLRLRAVS